MYCDLWHVMHVTVTIIYNAGVRVVEGEGGIPLV